jgi:nucleotide-binding universal stress UspA family protein
MSKVTFCAVPLLYLSETKKSGTMKNFLVPTDFSANAQKALDYGVKLALRCKATIHLVHSYSLLENLFIDSPSLRDAYNKTRKEEKTAELLRLKQYVKEKYDGLEVEVHLFTGPTLEVLIQFVQENGIDLIVMGTKGATGLAKLIVGSVTASIMEESPVPVLAIPEEYGAHHPENLLLAIKDFEENKEQLDPLFNLAALFEVPVHVFSFQSDLDSAFEISEWTFKFNRFIEFLHKTYPRAQITGSLKKDEDFEDAINGYCSAHNIGLIGMITVKRGFWEKLIDPSMTKRMAYQTKIPLYAIPALAGE